MPICFTATSPSEYYSFPFDKYLNQDIFKHALGSLPFFKDWKNFWIDTLIKEDELLKSNIDKVINPLKSSEETHEMFDFKFNSPVGSYIYKFDIEKMKYLITHANVERHNFSLDSVHFNSSAPLIASKVNDNRLPFLVRFYGTPTPLLCVDGNKRLKAKTEIEKSDAIVAYLFDENYLDKMFFDKVDQLFYSLHCETEDMHRAMSMGFSSEQIFNLTLMSRYKYV
ncbi:hypothetical protein [Bacillus subtilis]|uniref:hypothetical protein n=1 Tax=Bacillus subtilis TaxID=1423 RepID=UPI00022D8F8D|nr:hypothetical protein [Bacillus subtilis]EHA30673.1 hypothetical protein BSSC8_22580 [Bacillus subtilis subsp. subtilis str. SC-8]MEA3602908.1 hypothetical protein [Bacillus subtilis]MEC1057365.1 hypothetical protein [Bacillus subtilis]UYL12629.1 hypothetical protein DUT89_10065 [Bacillus subtilis]